MRTTIDLDPRAHRIAKMLAARENKTLGRVISEAFLHVYAPEEVNVRQGVSAAGFPTIDIGRPISAKEVRDFLDEE